MRPVRATPIAAPPVGYTVSRARVFLTEARERERGGRLGEALRAYGDAIESADPVADGAVLAEALRRLGMMRRRRREFAKALELCQRSRKVALALGDPVLVAEALNATALVHIERGEWGDARRFLDEALCTGAGSDELRGRIEQNLGVMANIRGDLRTALAHYERSLDAFRAGRDERGCAIAYHNLGMISADRKLWDDADAYFRACLEIAETTGDISLRGNALLNRTEVYLARARYEDARQSVEEALRIFDRLGAAVEKAAAYKYLGVLYRETGHAALAEARLRAAIDLASTVGEPLNEAEASRELAVLYQGLGRNIDALKLLNAAHRLFGRLDARADLVDVAGKVHNLESVYLDIVRAWGRSIESTDNYTFGHSERVANYGAALAEAMGFDAAELTTIRIGAYLHDLGKVRVPHEILNKPGRLTPEEYEVMKLHPVYGIEMLAGVELPWDVKPIVRWHHEKADGSGYPDRLRGDEVPLTVQLVCAADVFDAMTSTRSYRSALTRSEALARMRAHHAWWRPDVLEAFVASVGAGC